MANIFNLFKKNIATKEVVKPTTTNLLPRDFLPFTQIEKEYNSDLLVFYYNTVSEINAIVTKIAEVAANVPILHVVKDSKGKEIDKGQTDVIKLLNNPNQYINGKSFRQNAFTNYYVTGNIYINKITPVGFGKVTQLYLLPSGRVFPFVQGAYEPYGLIPPGTDIRTKEISKYNWIVDNNKIVLEPESVIHIKDTSIGNDNRLNIVGVSRLQSAINNVKSLNYLNETINTILSRAGALGFVKKNNKSNEMYNGMDPDEKKRIENAFYRYGSTEGKMPIFFTDQDLNYVKILNALSDFMPIELSQHEFKLICKVLGGFPDVLLQATDTTFANMKEANKMLYSNIVMPILDNYLEAYTNDFKKIGFMVENEYLVADYSGIEALQEDLKLKADTEKSIDDVNRLRYDNNEITLNEKLEAMGLSPVPGGDMLKSDIPISQETLSQKLGVGGTQTFSTLLADPGLSNEQKYYSLIYLFGLSEEQARNLTNSKQNDTQAIPEGTV